VPKMVLRLLVLAFFFSAIQALCQDAQAPIYSEIIPASSGLVHNPVTDMQESFQAPATFGTLPTLDSILVHESSDGVVCGTEMAGKTTRPIGIDPTDRRVPVTPNCP
jgi:hypothetical protein